MNKRDLIKALFKNPTIKALYESGHFDASDINRAILMEASELEEAKPGPFSQIGKKGTPALKLRNNIGVNIAGGAIKHLKNNKDPSKVKAAIEKLKKYPEGFKIEQAKGHEKLFKEYVAFQIERLEKELQIFQANQQAEKTDNSDQKKQTAAAQQNLDKKVDSADKKVVQTLGAAPEGGENKKDGEGAPNKVAEFASYFDTAIPKEAADEFMTSLFGQGSADSQQKFNKLVKAFVVHYFIENNILTEAEGQLPAWEKSFDSFKKEMDLDRDTIATLSKILTDSSNTFHTAAAKVRDFIRKPDAEPQDEQDIGQKRKELEKRASVALSGTGVEDSELLNNKLFMIFLGTVLEKEGVIQEQEQQMESYVEKYLPQLDSEETRKEFYVTTEEAGELKTFLESNKENVDKIIAAVVKTSKDAAQAADLEDVSPPDLAEFQKEWTDVLMTFFGKNPQKSSFMRRLLLRSQAEMLYGVMGVLEQMADPEQMAAYTDTNQDDEREAQADKAKQEPEAPDNAGGEDATKTKDANKEKPKATKESLREAYPGGPSRSGALKLDTSPEGIAKSKGESADEAEPEEEVQPEPQQEPRQEPQSDKVELPAKTRRIIKQDLQSMVDLLRQLKLLIKDYSMYATRKSADPRFDGSKLKANMDELLVQVQDDIYDLHSNLKPVELAPETDDENLEEALSGIMLEEDDPERQAKIQLVRETYDNAKREYVYSLATSMEQGKWGKSQASAKKILEILKEEKFLSLFPTGMKTAGGKVMTVGKAYESMTAVIQEFVETVRDIVLISKEKYISKTSLTQAKNNLKKISLHIADLFRVPSKFSPEEIKQAKEEEAANPDNQAITDAPPEKLDQASEDNSAGPTSEEGGGPEDQPVDKIEYAIDDELKKNLGKVIGEEDPLILDFLHNLWDSFLSNLSFEKSHAEPMGESRLSDLKQFAKGVGRSLSTSDKKAVQQISQRLGLGDDQKSALKQAWSEINSDKLLRRFDLKQIADKIGKFFKHFKNFVTVMKKGEGFQSLISGLVNELERTGVHVEMRTTEEESRKSATKEEFSSLLAKAARDTINLPDPLIGVLFGDYGQKPSIDLIEILAPYFTIEGVGEKRRLKSEVEEIESLIDNPSSTKHEEVKKLFDDRPEDRRVFLQHLEELYAAIENLRPKQQEEAKKNLQNGESPFPGSNSVREAYKAMIEEYPRFSKIKNKEISSSKVSPVPFMYNFHKAYQKNPNMFEVDDNLPEKIVDYYKDYLEDQNNALTPNQVYDLMILKDTLELKDGSPSIKFEDLLQINKRGIEELIKRIDKDDLKKVLLNSSKEVQEFFLNHLSKRQALDMEEVIAYGGEVSKKAAREAERRIIETAIRLINAEEIFLNQPDEKGNLEEALKPIIATMLKEHYNY